MSILTTPISTPYCTHWFTVGVFGNVHYSCKTDLWSEILPLHCKEQHGIAKWDQNLIIVVFFAQILQLLHQRGKYMWEKAKVGKKFQKDIWLLRTNCSYRHSGKQISQSSSSSWGRFFLFCFVFLTVKMSWKEQKFAGRCGRRTSATVPCFHCKSKGEKTQRRMSETWHTVWEKGTTWE